MMILKRRKVQSLGLTERILMEAPLKCRWQWLEHHHQVDIPEDEVVAVAEEATEAEEETLVVAEVEAEVVDGMENNLISKDALEIGGVHHAKTITSRIEAAVISVMNLNQTKIKLESVMMATAIDMATTEVIGNEKVVIEDMVVINPIGEMIEAVDR